MRLGLLVLILVTGLASAQPPDWPQKRTDILARMQKVMGPLPGEHKRVPLDPRLENETDAGKYVRRKLTIAVEAGDRLPLYLSIP